MSQPNKIAEYIKTVCEQIRWKKAHPAVSKELNDHITDQKTVYLEQGMEESKATQEAIKQMGDPVIVGAQLDGTYRPKPNWSIVIFTISLLLLGVVLRIFIDVNQIRYYSSSDWNSIVFTTIIGIIIFVAGYLYDFTMLGKYSNYIYFGFLVVFLLSNLSHVFIKDRDIFLLLFPIIFAGIIYQQRRKGYLGLLACGLYFFIPAYYCYSSLSFFIMLSLTCVTMLTYAILKNWFNVKKPLALLMIYLIPLPVIGLVVYNNINYFITSQISNFPYMKEVGEILLKSKFIGSAPSSVYTTNILLYNLNNSFKFDYTLTYLIYKLGWISFIGIAAILAAFLTKIFLQFKKQKSLLGKLTSYAVLMTLTVQIVFYIARNLGLLPVYSATLPFFSSNSLSIIINMFLVGIMLSVFKTGDLVKDDVILNAPLEKRKAIELLNGKLIINIHR